MQNQVTGRRVVVVADPGKLHEQLSEAEAALRLTSITQSSYGILVTRHHPRLFTLALDSNVPFGETREQSFF